MVSFTFVDESDNFQRGATGKRRNRRVEWSWLVAVERKFQAEREGCDSELYSTHGSGRSVSAQCLHFFFFKALGRFTEDVRISSRLTSGP